LISTQCSTPETEFCKCGSVTLASCKQIVTYKLQRTL